MRASKHEGVTVLSDTLGQIRSRHSEDALPCRKLLNNEMGKLEMAAQQMLVYLFLRRIDHTRIGLDLSAQAASFLNISWVF